MAKPMIWNVALVAAFCAACSPTLDWREFVPEGSGLSVTLPCRPDRNVRAVPLAGVTSQMSMLSCAAGGATYALSFVDVADPARISPTLAALRAAAVGNLHAAPPQVLPLQIKGMTANDESSRLSIVGRLPDGSTVQEHAAFFTRGLRVYQAAVIGARPDSEAVQTFFSGLNFPE
jgi:hypothetical protein